MTDIVERLRIFDEFIRGAGPLDGLWFGESSRNTPFWWRRKSPLEEAAAEITRLRADRNAVIRECAEVAKCQGIESGCRTRRTKNYGLRREPYFTEITNEIENSILALIEGDE